MNLLSRSTKIVTLRSLPEKKPSFCQVIVGTFIQKLTSIISKSSEHGLHLALLKR